MIDLFKLHDNIEDKGAYSWIVVDGPKVFTNFQILLDKVTGKLNCSRESLSREVSKRIGCSTSMLYDILNGRTQWISLLLINDLLAILGELGEYEQSAKLKDKFLDSIKFLKSAPRSTVIIKTVKQLSPQLAELCGIHAADGSLNLVIDIESKKKRSLVEIQNRLHEEFPELKISKTRKRNNKYVIYFYLTRQTREKVLKYLNGRNINFNVSYKVEFVEREKNSMKYLKKLIADLFGYNIKIKRKKGGNCYCVLFSNKIIGRYLKNIFDFPIGKKSDIVDAPELVRKSPFSIQKAFTRGLMQFDGSVKMKGTIAFSTNSRQLLIFLLEVVERDKLEGITWRRKHREQELGFESLPTKQWLTYFIEKTSKYQRLYEHIYGFTGRIKSMEEAMKIFEKAFPQKNRSTLSLIRLISMTSKTKEFTRYQVSDKLNTRYKTLEAPVRILEKAQIVKVDRREMLERFEGKSDKITFNPNIKEWRVPCVFE